MATERGEYSDYIIFIICQEVSGICVYYVININLSSVNYI